MLYFPHTPHLWKGPAVQKIGRYLIESELGKGAMGVVYKATDPNIGRPVALKTLRLDVHGIEAEEMRRRFQNEARAAGVINHPNIITIYDAGEDQDLFYIAMEYIPGQTLAELLQQQRVLPVEQIVAITRGVCAGLDFAHEKGIIHRDIKPANIMIAPDGTPKIMDFGIAKAAGNLTNTGQVLGTPNYMSPEQVRGRTLDGRTDLFSLGVVVYEMLTGEKPFGGQNVTTIIYKIVNENPIPPRDLDASIHPGLSAIVTRALSKDPAERYQTGAELAKDLANHKTYSSDANTTLTGITTSTTVSMSGEQTLIGTGSTLAVPVAVVPVPSTKPTGDTTAVPIFVAPPPPLPPTAAVPEKRSNKALFAVLAVIVLVLAGLVIAKRNRDRRNTAGAGQTPAPPSAQVAPPIKTAQGASTASDKHASAVPAPSSQLPPKGEVNITSTPPGAKLEIDGNSRAAWVTPLRNEKLDPGKHTVTVTLDRYTPEMKTIEVLAGKKTNLDVNLTTNFGVVHISSVPEDADILLNGQATGKKTPADFILPSGNQVFTLRKQGFENSGDTVAIEAGQSINLTPKLTALAGPNDTPLGKLGKFFRGAQGEDRGLLIVRSKPRGAHVTINGFVLPGATPVRIPIKSGKYAVGIAMAGFQPVKRDVLVERGKQTGLNEELVRK